MTTMDWVTMAGVDDSSEEDENDVEGIVIACGVLGGLFFTCVFISCIKAIR